MTENNHDRVIFVHDMPTVGFFGGIIVTSPNYKDEFISSPVPRESGSQHRPSFSVETIHISCQSDSYQGNAYSYAGVIIYSCDGKSEWKTTNGSRCKSGYLVIMDAGTEKVKKYQGTCPGLARTCPDLPGTCTWCCLQECFWRRMYHKACQRGRILDY